MGTKSQFTVSEMNPRMSISLNNSDAFESDSPSYSNISTIYTITDMVFIIDQNLYVDKIDLVYEVANTKLYEEVKEQLTDLKISPKFTFGGLNKEYQVSGFFIEI